MSEVRATPDLFWRSLRLFCYYRFAVAGFLLIVAARYSDATNVGSQSLALFVRVATFYVGAAIAFIVVIQGRSPRFSLQLALQILVDIIAITLMMYASGGQKSGLAVLVLISLAGAGLVSDGRMVLFFAAVASLSMLFEQSVRILGQGADSGDFFRTGLICLGFFGMALTARLLARRVVANEELARARGEALDRQVAVGRRIIADMTDGVLVLDPQGQVQQFNATAERLLQIRPGVAWLRDWSVSLARQLIERTEILRETDEIIRTRAGKLLRLRLLPAAERGADAVVYVEDMERIQIQAQQLKLAALGRISANIAHEIRNPLAAISHAAELLAEDEHDPLRRRLAMIVGDNAVRLNRLVSDVLDLGRRDRAQPEAVAWTDFMARFMEEFTLHDPSAHTRVRLDGEALSVRFDRGHLQRVIWNLLANALRHATAAPGAVCVHIQTAGPGKAAVHLVDDGCGVGEELREHLFEPFVTSQGSGCGLGLYIARELCEANGATLDLGGPAAQDFSPPGGNLPGAHFVMTLEAVN